MIATHAEYLRLKDWIVKVNRAIAEGKEDTETDPGLKDILLDALKLKLLEMCMQARLYEKAHNLPDFLEPKENKNERDDNK